MIKLVKNISRKAGVDKAIFFTVMSRVVQAGGGVLTLFFVAKSLTKTEQGYYYTFGSILAIQIFFELGLSNIITQFVAHENVNLDWDSDTSFNGSSESSSRLASLLRFTIRWFSIISCLLFIGLIVAGFFFFRRFGDTDNQVTWQVPWVILSMTTALTLMVSPILAFFEGLGMVAQVTKIRFIQQLVQLLCVLALFYLDFKLFSVPIATVISFAIVPIWIFSTSKMSLLQFVWKKLSIWHIDYRSEIFPYQWRIALSWISGYFIFQLFNPVLFATEGAIVAGQMGMTLTVLNSIFALAFSWMSTKIPVFSTLIAKREFVTLDNLFRKTLKQSSLLNILALVVFCCAIQIIRRFNIEIGNKNFGERFLPFLPMLFMMVPIFLNHVIGSWATYLRCHKEEPMLIQSIVMGILCSISTVALGKYFGVYGITFGYMVLTVFSLVWTFFTFLQKKNEWHK